MITPKISIIVPVYNAGKYLPKCLESILSQTYEDFELLLIDDGSTDESGAICDRYALIDTRIRVFHKENGGVSSARNVGLDNAVGEWITFSDSDDYLDNYALNIYARYMHDRQIDIIRAGYRIIRTNSIECVSCDREIIKKCDSSLFETIEGTKYYGFLWNTCFRREIICDIRFDISISWSEDHLFSATAAYNCNQIVFSPEIVYNYIMHESGSLSIPNNPNMLFDVANAEYFAKKKLFDRDKKNVSGLCNQLYKSSVFMALNVAFKRFDKKQFKEYISTTKPNLIPGIYFGKIISVLYCRMIPFPLRYHLGKYVFHEIKR